ncbi:MAG: 1-deoxy-D-xylulose-5-phosphate reductoisomerase [Clostridiales bacterium]|nr:1-deoxy-D-xylulose-5-phosphate reductoisomerase [Candidatus Crickella caballi]
MKKILILGSTGSIGCQALDIIRENKDKFSAIGLSCRSRIDNLINQIREFEPEAVCVGNAEDAKRVQNEFPHLTVYYGDDGLVQLANIDCDIVLNSLMGISGLAPTYRAIEMGRDIALANKETLVTGGALITGLCEEKGVKLLPVDSEHSAIFQCLEGNKGREVRRILLTASGGPFRGRSLESLKDVTVEQALNHPKWSMGSKITIDSATMMNKGLEVIEAKWLFDVPADRIDIHVHPQSIVHSMVEFCDTSVIAQMGLPDMRIPISLALNYPDRLQYGGSSLDFFTAGKELTFEKPDRKVFKCIDLAYRALEEGGSYTVAMNGANEELVAMFLKGEISFLDIPDTIEKVMNAHKPGKAASVEEILNIDKEARIMARELVRR